MERGRRYRAVGGVAAWRVPVVFGVVTAAAISVGEWSVACLVMVAGLAMRVVDRAVVFDVCSVGLTRAVVVGDTWLGGARVLTWQSIEEITTRWRRPRDFSAMETIVTSRDAGAVRFGSRMGWHAYGALLADIVRHAPHARRTGLTEELLAETRPRAAA